MNKEQYKAHLLQRLTEEKREVPPESPANYRPAGIFTLEDEDIDRAEDEDVPTGDDDNPNGPSKYTERKEARKKQKAENENKRDWNDIFQRAIDPRQVRGGEADWDAARDNPDLYDADWMRDHPDSQASGSRGLESEFEIGSTTDRDIAAGIWDIEMGIPGAEAKLVKRLEFWRIPKKKINDTSELIAAQAEKDIRGTHDQTYKDMEDVRIDAEKKEAAEKKVDAEKKSINDTSELIAAQAEKDIRGTHDQTYKDMEDVRIDAEKKVDAEKKSIKEQYKAHFRQRLYEGDVIDKVKSIAGEVYAKARNVFGPSPGELLVLAVKDLMDPRQSVTDTITNDTSNLRYAARDIPGVAAVEKKVAEAGYFPTGGFYDRNSDGKEDDVESSKRSSQAAKRTPKQKEDDSRPWSRESTNDSRTPKKKITGHPGEIPNSDPLPSDTQRA